LDDVGFVNGINNYFNILGTWHCFIDRFDFVPLTIALLVIGPPAGALAGNYLNFSCRHSKKRQLALALGFAIQICVGLFLIAISFDGAFKPFKLLEGIVMLASPLIAKQMLKSWFHYCEQCKKPMEEVKYKYGVNASPGRLISGLNSSILINEDEAKHTREDEVFHGQKYIEVAMYNAVIAMMPLLRSRLTIRHLLPAIQRV
jgi:hypothetical protein